jgi:hypothetical protein
MDVQVEHLLPARCPVGLEDRHPAGAQQSAGAGAPASGSLTEPPRAGPRRAAASGGLREVGDDDVEQAFLAAEVAVELGLVRVRRRDDAVDPGAGDAALGELRRGRVEDAPAGRGAPRRGRQFGRRMWRVDAWYLRLALDGSSGNDRASGGRLPAVRFVRELSAVGQRSLMRRDVGRLERYRTRRRRGVIVCIAGAVIVLVCLWFIPSDAPLSSGSSPGQSGASGATASEITAIITAIAALITAIGGLITAIVSAVAIRRSRADTAVPPAAGGPQPPRLWTPQDGPGRGWEDRRR